MAIEEHAACQVRDYLDTIEPDVDHAGVEVIVHPELEGDLAHRVRSSPQATDLSKAVTLSRTKPRCQPTTEPGRPSRW